jgi:hypothetical protein
VRHEALISAPGETIRSWCGCFGLEAPADYVRACGAIVFPSPHRSRAEVQWPPALVDEVRRRMAACPFLEGYDAGVPDAE